MVTGAYMCVSVFLRIHIYMYMCVSVFVSPCMPLITICVSEESMKSMETVSVCLCMCMIIIHVILCVSFFICIYMCTLYRCVSVFVYVYDYNTCVSVHVCV